MKMCLYVINSFDKYIQYMQLEKSDHGANHLYNKF